MRCWPMPVLDGQQVVGMLTATDLTELRSGSAVQLSRNIHKPTRLDGLVEAAAKMGPLQRQLAAAQVSAYATGHIVTAITAAITSRLLQLAEAELGPPPVDYAWVAAGSQARNEQSAKSDQDNCLVLDDAYDEAVHGDYFKALASQVDHGLNACGYVFCLGDMMARTDQWRQPQRVWAEYFRRWTDTPEPMALMLTCVFFDLRLIQGRASLPARRPAPRRAAAHPQQPQLSGLHGGQRAAAPAALVAVRWHQHHPLGPAPQHGRPQAQRHRAHRRPGAHLRAGRRPCRGEQP